MLKKQEIIVKQSPLAKSKSEVFCDIFSYEPELITEKALGSFYLISQHSINKEEFSSLPNLINSSLKRNFYKNPQLGTLDSLKFSLSQTNEFLRQDFAKSQTFDFSELFYFVVVVKKNEIHIATAGQNAAWLYKNEQLNDLNQKMVPPPKKQVPEKFFESFISVNLRPKDTLFLGTPNFSEIITSQGLLQIAQEKKLTKTVEKINKIIREEKHPQPLATLVLKRLSRKTKSVKDKQQDEYITPPINLWKILK